jgi:hypothetical protein
MSAAPERPRPVLDYLDLKENTQMPKRLATLAALSVSIVLLALMPVAPASATSPWWQVLTGSRPTSMWEPEDNIQEITSEESAGILAAKIEVEGNVIGCLGAGEFAGFPADLVCQLFGIAPEATETAAELEALLEGAFGTAAVEVSGGPAGSAPLLVTVGGRSAPTITISTTEFGTAKAKILSIGGSGRLVLTLTNLGNESVDGTGTPVTIGDHLPGGAIATGVEASAGRQNLHGPIKCAVEASDEVVCSYEGKLPSYEAIEIEIFTSLTGSPPVAGAPGQITVTGGNAEEKNTSQTIKVSPEPVPFGIEQFSAVVEEEGGKSASQAGGHPYQLTTTLQLNAGSVIPTSGEGLVKGARPYATEQPALPRNLRFPLPAGMIGNVTAIPQCPMPSFFKAPNFGLNLCPPQTVLGVSSVTVVEKVTLGLIREAVPVYNLPPAQGEPARLGFIAAGIPIVVDTTLDPDNSYQIIASVRNASQLGQFLASTTTLWGTPGDPAHDNARGWSCLFPDLVENGELSPCERPAGLSESAFLRQPVSCNAPLDFGFELEPWNVPIGSQIAQSSFMGEPLLRCSKIPFNPKISSTPTSKLAGSSSGLDFRLDMPGSGLLTKSSIAEGQAKKVEVTLPEGVTVNPSQAEGLGACSPAEYAQERFDSVPGDGCPESSKVGSVDISTPLLEEEAHGAVYIAKSYDNPFNSLLALYLVAKIPDRGVLVKQAGELKLDPESGQLVTTFDDLPQVPFETFKLHFFEGNRAPLVMPPACDDYDIVAKFTPWHASDPSNPLPSEIVTTTSSFSVDQGPNGGPCPSGTPPFKPGFVAGTESNSAGKYSPFTARLTRNDDEQEFTRFSVKLPKGVIGSLAGIPFCSDAAIAAARARTGPNGGQEELESPSCLAASQIGRTLVGAGVGPSLTYVPGKLYLAGPYQGAKLSVAAITAVKVGPFDLGNVVIRQALKVNPETAEVSTDGTSSDPIPHILQGIVVHARDIRIFVDRKDFILNPTSCERMTADASVIGSGLDFGSLGDDQSVDVTSPFQAADCASLGFKPKLAISLSGGTHRGDTPRLKAVLTARKGDANIGAAVVTLPHSEFLEQAHIRTVCTRVQFNAGGGNGEQCPKGSVYGHVKAITPLLDEPLSGAVYLRSSSHPLPDLVAALHSGKVDINLAGRIDSVRNGRIRNSFQAVPDAPVTKFTLQMQGGKKGLLVNSQNICRGKHRAIATFIGQNGKRHEINPLVKASCGKGKKHKR